MNFPIHSFSGTVEQRKPVVEASFAASQIPLSEGPSIASSPSFPVEDIIKLQDDKDLESRNGDLETTEDKDDNLAVSAWEIDEEDEPMSLSDLSSSFKQCFESSKQNRKARQVDELQESSRLHLKPFDYEAARKQVIFGDDSKAEGEGQISRHGSGGKKNSSVTGRVLKDDGSKELSQGKRRQAFPATGNRSASFR